MSLPFTITAAAIFLWSILSVVSRVLLLNFHLDPWFFSFMQLFSGGIILLVMGGKHTFSLASFRLPFTWIIGMLRVLSAALYTAALVWISVLEAGTIGTFAVPLIAIALWLFHGKQPSYGEWTGHIVITGAIIALFFHIENTVAYEVLWLMVSNALCLVLISILAERHPDNISDEPGARFRFTGSVLLVTASFFLLLKLGQGGATAPFLDWQSISISVAVGVTLRAPSMVFAFWSIRLVGAQNYLAAIALLPFAGMVLEQAAVAYGLLSSSRLQTETFVLALVVAGGTLIVVFARSRANRRLSPDIPSTHR
ncbi:MAG: hypothetical protein ABJN40_16015 [Sneathiella sp.]